MEDNGHSKEEYREEADEGQHEQIDPETGEVVEPWYLRSGRYRKKGEKK